MSLLSAYVSFLFEELDELLEGSSKYTVTSEVVSLLFEELGKHCSVIIRGKSNKYVSVLLEGSMSLLSEELGK